MILALPVVIGSMWLRVEVPEQHQVSLQSPGLEDYPVYTMKDYGKKLPSLTLALMDGQPSRVFFEL